MYSDALQVRLKFISINYPNFLDFISGLFAPLPWSYESCHSCF